MMPLILVIRYSFEALLLTLTLEVTGLCLFIGLQANRGMYIDWRIPDVLRCIQFKYLLTQETGACLIIRWHKCFLSYAEQYYSIAFYQRLLPVQYPRSQERGR
jgi:hypothetical protein